MMDEADLNFEIRCAVAHRTHHERVDEDVVVPELEELQHVGPWDSDRGVRAASVSSLPMRDHPQ